MSTLLVVVLNLCIAVLTYSDDAATVTFFANVVASGHQLDGALDERATRATCSAMWGLHGGFLQPIDPKKPRAERD